MSDGTMMFGQYEVQEILGFGGMGMVYKGHQASLKRDVAIKVLNVTATNTESYAIRFAREAEMAAMLEHPHIVPIYDHGTTPDGVPYVVMRLLTGGSLADRLEHREAHETPLPTLTEVAKLLQQIAGALDYAHERGIIHRDIKPNNIMFDDKGNAYLVDFGIAKLMQDEAQAVARLTKTGGFVGTPPYMPPELWSGGDWVAGSDQYALGVVIYETLTGRLPFEASTLYQLIQQHITATPRWPHDIRKDVPESLSHVIERALSKEPEDRYPNLAAFAEAFDEAVQDAALTGSHAPSGFFNMPSEVGNSTRILSQAGKVSLQQTVALSRMQTTRGDLEAATAAPAVSPPRLPKGLWGVGAAAALVLLLGLGMIVSSNGTAGMVQATLQAVQTFQAGNPNLLPAESLAATATACLAQMPMGGQASGQIAFYSDRDDERYNIFLMNADGTGARALTTLGNNTDPAWSHNGRALAFISDRDGTDNIYLLVSAADNPDLFSEQALTANRFENAAPSWSPDDQAIVYASTVNGNWDIFVVAAAGGEALALTDHKSDDYSPVWSPDGQSIAFVSERDGHQEVYLMNANGSNVRRLTNSDANSGGLLSWSPDSQSLLYLVKLSDGNWEINRVDVNSGAAVDVSQLIGDEWNAVWSPDGKAMVYLWQSDNIDLAVAAPDGSNRRVLKVGQGDKYTASWSPDSQWLVFDGEHDGNWEIYISDTCGSVVQRLTNNDAVDSIPSWRPPLK